jgi:hypothetical protein
LTPAFADASAVASSFGGQAGLRISDLEASSDTAQIYFVKTPATENFLHLDSIKVSFQLIIQKITLFM